MNIEVKQGRLKLTAENEAERCQLNELGRDLEMRTFDHGRYYDGRLKEINVPLIEKPPLKLF